MKRKVYQRKHFKAEENINKALETLHAAYVKKYAAKGRKRKTLSAADMLEDDGKKAGERRVVFAEIARLSSLGYSIAKAIETMKSGSYGSRMRGVKSETWRRYYTEYMRRKALRKRAKALGRDRVNETIKEACETIKADGETINETIKSVIRTKSGISGKMIVEAVSKSRATVMRALAALKLSGEIVYRGSKKTGGYYANS